ncbi:S8 family serine peptidase [Brevibacillus sp. HB1.3]|uniref:S8 family serine peptidase n=1 Tax=Brevibacillus sp. HB1.3 TaxID=2738842 RepID=UPI001555FDEC|nr:S8 family serine peptidase [Brevibacillus sp. HB1.3]NQF14451.1 S8 family serine peptidase [Brevibacillus sp. HB1.3]
MKKKVCSIGLILALLPATTVSTTAFEGTATIRTQILQDLAEMHEPLHTGKADKEYKTTADEWQRQELLLRGEQLKSAPVDSLEMIEATKAWEEAGVKGEGMLVSVIDTGINPRHPDLPAPHDKRSAMQKSGSSQKVIPGFNWADRTQTTEDVSESQHGIHVAGIIGANGKVKGVAPEAQLISQKVFSNYQSEVPGLGESILFAINDSITKKADVINLSLGSSAGYVDETNVEQMAVKRAVDNGIVVVAAAGNDAYFGSDKVRAQNPDIAMIGSPGLSPDAFSVASINATALAGYSFTVQGIPGMEKVVYLSGYVEGGGAINPVMTLMKPYPLVYMGKGKKEDYNVSVKDKVVLLERGDISFDEKLRLAKEAGAVGAVIYNNEMGPLIISAEHAKQIPAVSILKHMGEQMAQAIKKGKKVTVSFNGEYGQNPMPYPDGGTISAFSSWGPTPDLQFKPEIAAPGGGILSLTRESEYAVKSGTSMATPHVAGGMALLKQGYLKQGRNLQGRSLVDTLKAAAMNTAEPIIDPQISVPAADKEKAKKVPYSPRVQGAGLMQTAKAIKTPAIVVTAKGKAGVSLGEIGNSTTFSLFINNKFGKKPITYQLQNEFGVLTDLRKNGLNMLTDTLFEGAELQFSAPKITVAPGKLEEVKVTLTIPPGSARNQFAEGFISFQPDDKELPTLRTPFYGFYGDWDEPRIMDQPVWEAESQEKRTGVKTSWYHDKRNDKWRYRDYLGVTGVKADGGAKIDPNHIAFSPNGDGHYDVAAPSITFLRNARHIIVEVTDQSGKPIRTLVRDEKVSKYDQSKLGTPYYYTEREAWSWDGKIFSPQKGAYIQAPDGQYHFSIKAKIDDRNANWQSMTLPIRVDTKAPVITASVSGNRVQWSSRDKDIQAYFLYVNGKRVGGPYSPKVSSTLINQPDKKMSVVAHDYAGNISVAHINGKSDSTPPFVEFPDDLFPYLKISKQPDVAFRGKVTGEDMMDRVRLSINKTPVKLATDGSFETILRLTEGLNYVMYSAMDMYGNKRQFTQRVIVDTSPPILQLLNDGSEDVQFDPATKNMLVPVRFLYRDQTYKGQVSINGQIVSYFEEEQLEIPAQKYVTQILNMKQGENRILLEGKDGAGNQSMLLVYAYVDANSGAVVISNGEQRISYKARTVPAPTIQLPNKQLEGQEGEALPIEGKVTGAGAVNLQINYGSKSFQTKANDQGLFRLVLHEVEEGKQKVTVVATDALGREARAEMNVVGKKK